MGREKEELTLEEQVERIRKKRMRSASFEGTRSKLNTLFLIFAAIGLVLYFSNEDYKFYGLGIIGIGMILKVAEFFIRFLL